MHPLVQRFWIATLLASLPRLAVAQSASIADSIVLERTLCYGSCPAYRVSISRVGEVRFESRRPGDSGRTASDRIAAERVRSLTAQAVALGFFQLPDSIRSDKRLCPDMATDHPTVITIVALAGVVHRVVDYRGCFARSDHSVVDSVAKLRAYEAAIDSAAGSARWVRPSRSARNAAGRR